MSFYRYQARDDKGKLIRGILEADGEMDLANRLKKSGLFLTASSQAAATRQAQSRQFSRQRLSVAEQLNFTVQLAISLEAGVPLLTSLKDMVRSAKLPGTKMVVDDIARRVESGVSFRDALANHPRSFADLYVAIVGAGETTGKLHFVLQDLSRLLEWQNELRSKVKEASIYPIILFCVMIMVVGVLLGTVIPKFEPMLKQLGVGLPAPTLFVLNVSRVLQENWLAGLIGVGAAVGGWIYANSRPKGRYVIDKYKLRAPVLGELFTKVALSRFCHTFSLSLRSGVNVFSSLGIASEVTGNVYFQTAIVKAKNYVNMGEKISTALELAGKESGGQFPDIVIRMINVGEQSGSLTETLEKVNQYYDKEVPAMIRKMFAILEPMMIVIMGVVVGGIAMAVFLPMIKMMSTLGD